MRQLTFIWESPVDSSIVMTDRIQHNFRTKTIIYIRGLILFISVFSFSYKLIGIAKIESIEQG